MSILYKILKFLFPGLFSEEKEINNSPNIIYKEKNIMTTYERGFYLVLSELETSHKLKIHPQLNLASIIDKISDQRYRSELFRNIDFAIFNEDYSKLLLLIEINDNTHNTKKRQSRDIKVQNICKNANIKLITFYTKYQNEKSYVLNRVIKEIYSKTD